MVLLYSMSQFLSNLIVPAVFCTKDLQPFLHSEEIRIETYAYMAGITLNAIPFKIGGVDDHVHILSSLSKLREFLKRHRVAYDERYLWE
jgi:hypothetical protein